MLNLLQICTKNARLSVSSLNTTIARRHPFHTPRRSFAAMTTHDTHQVSSAGLSNQIHNEQPVDPGAEYCLLSGIFLRDSASTHSESVSSNGDHQSALDTSLTGISVYPKDEHFIPILISHKLTTSVCDSTTV